MPRELDTKESRQVTDWSGRLLNKRVLDLLVPGCIVRIVVTNLKQGGGEALYVRITKIKDGSLWGVIQDTYRMFDYVGLPTGKEFTFRFSAISEVPLNWQPKRIRNKMEIFLDKRNRGRAITGMFL